MSLRIIPRLDIKGPNLVKGVHLEGLRVLGRPETFARYYYEQGADELIYMDVVASLYERNSLEEIVKKTAKEIFIPLTVGGGLRTIDDIRNILRAGADKVALNTAAIRNPELIRKASEKFGSSTIVVAIEAIRQANGEYLAFVDNGREYTGIEVVQWAKKVEALGAGEILITSVDKEGTGKGFDKELCRRISEAVSLPVIAHGGAGSKEDVLALVNETEVAAVAIASVLHYASIKEVMHDKEERTEGNIDFLKSGKFFSKVAPCSIKEVKKLLMENHINCRP